MGFSASVYSDNWSTRLSQLFLSLLIATVLFQVFECETFSSAQSRPCGSLNFKPVVFCFHHLTRSSLAGCLQRAFHARDMGQAHKHQKYTFYLGVLKAPQAEGCDS